ncbi:MAG: hypothetical protein R3E98_16885 [Gemmatimonadota bacterium]
MHVRDAIVIGGGPAGSAAFALLRVRGLDVVWIPGPARPHAALALSLPPTCGPLFQRAGFGSLWDAPEPLRSGANRVHWAGETRHEAFAPGMSARLCEAGDLERWMRRDAQAADGTSSGRTTSAGRLLAGRAVTIEPGTEASAVRVEAPGASATHHARWVLDCTGRGGVSVRCGLAERTAGPAALAVSARWRVRDGSPEAAAADTVIESQSDGWGWSIPLPDGTRDVSFLVDPRHSALVRGDLEVLYAERLRAAPELGALLSGAERRSAAWACEAGPYAVDPPARPGLLLVGDAASALDPLTSFGVKKALASAWLATAVVETALTEPDLLDAALLLHTTRERAIPARLRSDTAGFATDAERVHAHPFWTARARAEEDGLLAADPDVEGLRTDPEVLRAFAALREPEHVGLTPGRVQTALRPTVVGTRVGLEERLLTPRWPDGVRHLRGVDLLALARLARPDIEVPELWERYCRQEEPVILPDFLGALSVLVAEGVLRMVRSPSPS